MGLHQSYLEFIQNNQLDSQSRVSMQSLPGAAMSTQFRYYAGKNEARSQCMSQRDFLKKANQSDSGFKLKTLNNFKKNDLQNHDEEKKLSEKIKQTI